MLYIACVWRHRRIRRDARDKRSAFQPVWSFFLYARLDNCLAHFRKRRRTDRAGCSNRSWKLLEGFCRICRHSRWPRRPESPSIQDPKKAEQVDRSSKTRAVRGSSSRAHCRRRSKRVLHKQPEVRTHSPSSEKVISVKKVQMHKMQSILRRSPRGEGSRSAGVP